MKKLGFIALALVYIFTTTIYAKSENKPLEQMTLTTYDGKILDIIITEDGFKFKQFPNKTVLLNFFGPMCPPCIIEIPHLIELQKEHKNNLQILAIQVQVPMENDKLADFIKQNHINYPAVNLNDAWDIVSFIKANTNWGGQIPFTMVFDKDGELKNSYMGLISKEKIISDMKK